MDVTFVQNRSYFNSACFQRKNILGLEDRWDRAVEEESKKEKEDIETEKNDTTSKSIDINKDDRNRIIVDPKLRDNSSNISYSQLYSVSPNITSENPVETSANPLTNNETMAKRPKISISMCTPGRKNLLSLQLQLSTLKRVMKIMI